MSSETKTRKDWTRVLSKKSRVYLVNVESINSSDFRNKNCVRSKYDFGLWLFFSRITCAQSKRKSLSLILFLLFPFMNMITIATKKTTDSTKISFRTKNPRWEKEREGDGVGEEGRERGRCFRCSKKILFCEQLLLDIATCGKFFTHMHVWQDYFLFAFPSTWARHTYLMCTK